MTGIQPTVRGIGRGGLVIAINMYHPAISKVVANPLQLLAIFWEAIWSGIAQYTLRSSKGELNRVGDSFINRHFEGTGAYLELCHAYFIFLGHKTCHEIFFFLKPLLLSTQLRFFSVIETPSRLIVNCDLEAEFLGHNS